MARPDRHDDAGLPLFGWQPPSKVVPFPSSRRLSLVARNARRMTEMREDKAMAHLDRTLDAMAARLARLGIDTDTIAADIAAARVAVLDRYRVMLACDGGAA